MWHAKLFNRIKAPISHLGLFSKLCLSWALIMSYIQLIICKNWKGIAHSWKQWTKCIVLIIRKTQWRNPLVAVCYKRDCAGICRFQSLWLVVGNTVHGSLKGVKENAWKKYRAVHLVWVCECKYRLYKACHLAPKAWKKYRVLKLVWPKGQGKCAMKMTEC